MTEQIKPIETMNGWTYSAMFQYLRDRMLFTLGEMERFENMTPMDASLMLMDFENIHGPESLWDLCGALHYFVKHAPDNAEERFVELFLHDVVGRKKAFMLPRSTGYQEYINC